MRLMRYLSTFSMVKSIDSPLKVCRKFKEHKAITDQYGSHTYGEVWARSVALAIQLQRSVGKNCIYS